MTVKNIGSRTQVMNGNAKKTAGGLTQGKLMYNKHGEIVSRAASNAAKKSDNLSFWKVKKNAKGDDFKDFLRPKKGTKAYKDFIKNEGDVDKKSSKKKSSKKKSKKIHCSKRKKSKCKRASKTCKWSTKKKKCSKR